jgi:folate-binding protein YgfZ
MAWPGRDAADLLVPAGVADATIERLVAAGAARAGIWAFEALRVEARRPRLGLETDHRTIAHEVGWIGPAVHLDKGCYRGQETVARVQNLGKPPRRLVLLHLSGESDELPEPGTPVQLDSRAVGFLGTSVHHFELGPVALAVVKRTLAGGVVLDVGGQPASIDPD